MFPLLTHLYLISAVNRDLLPTIFAGAGKQLQYFCSSWESLGSGPDWVTHEGCRGRWKFASYLNTSHHYVSRAWMTCSSQWLDRGAVYSSLILAVEWGWCVWGDPLGVYADIWGPLWHSSDGESFTAVFTGLSGYIRALGLREPAVNQQPGKSDPQAISLPGPNGWRP